jgi:hypothetical protein
MKEHDVGYFLPWKGVRATFYEDQRRREKEGGKEAFMLLAIMPFIDLSSVVRWSFAEPAAVQNLIVPFVGSYFELLLFREQAFNNQPWSMNNQDVRFHVRF